MHSILQVEKDDIPRKLVLADIVEKLLLTHCASQAVGNVTLHSVEHVTFYKLYNRSVAKVTLDDVMLKVKEIIDTMCVAKMTAILFNCCMFELLC